MRPDLGSAREAEGFVVRDEAIILARDRAGAATCGDLGAVGPVGGWHGRRGQRTADLPSRPRASSSTSVPLAGDSKVVVQLKNMAVANSLKYNRLLLT